MKPSLDRLSATTLLVAVALLLVPVAAGAAGIQPPFLAPERCDAGATVPEAAVPDLFDTLHGAQARGVCNEADCSYNSDCYCSHAESYACVDDQCRYSYSAPSGGSGGGCYADCSSHSDCQSSCPGQNVFCTTESVCAVL